MKFHTSIQTIIENFHYQSVDQFIESILFIGFKNANLNRILIDEKQNYKPCPKHRIDQFRVRGQVDGDNMAFDNDLALVQQLIHETK